MRKFFFAFLTILFLILAALDFYGQAPFRIQAKCAQPNSRESATITATATGITHVPCPTKPTIFRGNVSFDDATVLPSFRMLDKDFLNFQGIPAYFSIGNRPSAPITLTSDLYLADLETVMRGDFSVGGLFSFLNVSSPTSTDLSFVSTAGLIGGATNPADLNTNRTLIGVQGYAYQRSAIGSVAAIGGDFQAFTGGNVAVTNPTEIYGIKALAMGGHNGTSPLVTAGRFNVSNLGGGGVGNITQGIAVHALFDGGAPITNYINAKGLFVGGWSPANGGTYTNSYGIHLDSTIDKGTALRYAILSESTSDSVFSGAVKGVINAYGVGWDGSNKFATEDAVYDKIESLGTSTVTGTGVANKAAFWTNASTLTNVPLDLTGDKFTFYKVTTGDAFRAEITPSNAGAGSVLLGKASGGFPAIVIDEALNRISVETSRLRLGDFGNNANGTSIEIRDSLRQFDFLTGSTSGGIFRMLSIDSFLYRRTVTAGGTTGAQVIDRPAGSVNFGAGASTLVVTNSTADASSLIFLTPQANDATCKSFAVTRAAGSFTITANAACTAETAVAFMVTN